MIARNLGAFSLTSADLEAVKAGISDGVLAKTPKVDLQAYGPKIQPLQTARPAAAVEKKASQPFRAASPSRSRSTASSSAGARACRS